MNLFSKKIDNFFKITERNSSFKQEAKAGIITFLAVNYILLVIPATLLPAMGRDLTSGMIFTATALSTIIGTLVMAIYANYPITVMPGLGFPSFLAVTIVAIKGYTWQEALFATFMSGLIFFILSITGVRKKLINLIPVVLKNAVTAGIGFFIAFIGLKSAGIVVSNPETFISLGNFKDPLTALTLLGVLLIFILMIRNNKSAIFISMAVITIIGIILQSSGVNVGVSFPDQLVSLPPNIYKSFGAIFQINIWKLLTDFSFWIIIISVFFIDFFDNTGAMLAVGRAMGTVDSTSGEVTTSNKAFITDSLASMIGATLGVTTSAMVVENIAGIKEGGKTGLTALTTAFLFFLALFFSPVLGIFSVAVTAPVLITIGITMAIENFELDPKDIVGAISSVIIILMILLTFSISEGLALGFLTYTVLRVVEGRGKEIPKAMYILDIFFLIFFFIS